MREDYTKFKTIVEYGNITEASKRLFISQPALSKYLATLERDLGARLIDRSTTPLTLTTAGKIFMRYIQANNTIYAKLLNDLADLALGTRGEVTFGINSWRGSLILPRLIPTLKAKYPNLQLHTIEGKSQNLLNELSRGNMEFCILNTSQFSTMGLTWMEILRENILVVCSHDFVRQNGLPRQEASGKWQCLDVEDLQKVRMILQSEGQNLSKFLNNWLNEHKVVPYDVVLIESIDTAIKLASEGYGITFVPGQGAYSRHMPENLCFYLLGTPPLSWSLNVYYKKAQTLTKFCNLVIEELINISNSPDNMPERAAPPLEKTATGVRKQGNFD